MWAMNSNEFSYIDTVRAFGDLAVQFGVPPEDPLFNIHDMMPGDEVMKEVVVMNNSAVPRFVAVKAVRTGPTPIPDPPLLEGILDVVIDDASVDLYGGTAGAKTVEDWFTDSGGEDGVLLSVLNPGESKTYRVKVKFPWLAGNEYQGKSVVFDLIFGVVTGDDLVINEVYYLVDEDHGLDSPKDRGILNVNGNDVTVIISDTGTGSTNTAVMKKSQVCEVIQEYNGSVINNIEISGNTGGNRGNGNTGTSSIFTGGIFNFISIGNFGNFNFSSGSCGKKLGQNDEWIEIYNPTERDISLKNWKLMDNSGEETIIHANKKVRAGGFALLSKDSRTWRFWDENRRAKKIELGQSIGDGLDNDGDHLFLINPDDAVVDFTAWGDDTADWNPAVPLATPGASMERLAPGFDTDVAVDWEERSPPAPGE